MKVLQKKTDIATSRRELDALGASALDSHFRRLQRRLGMVTGMPIGDFVKSWDVLQTIRFLQGHVAKEQPVLDIGAFASEIVVALHKLGYSDLTGVDLDPNLKEMPYSEMIRYEVCDFKKTPFPDGSFNAITSISVIEHGYDGSALFQEVTRLLKPGGYFIASFDYWQSKIDTNGIDFFGMSWNIFSEVDVIQLMQIAHTCGLHPIEPCEFTGLESPIRCGGKNYTFAWVVLKKDLVG